VQVSDFNETPNALLVGERGSTAQHDLTDEMNNARMGSNESSSILKGKNDPKK